MSVSKPLQFLFFLLFAPGFTSFSQSRTIDSLKLVLAKTDLCKTPCLNDTVYLSILAKIGRQQFITSALDDLWNTAEKGRILSDSLLKRTNDPLQKKAFLHFKARFIALEGNFYFAKDEQDSSISYHQTSLVLFKSLDDSFMVARELSNIGLSYLSKGKFDSAVYYCYHVINNFKDQKFKSLQAVCYNELSTVYRKADIYDKALEFCLAALKIAEENNDSLEISRYENSAANIYINLENYDQAKKYLQLSYAWAKANNNLRGIGVTATNLADTYTELNMPDSAIPYAKEGLNVKMRIGNMSLIPTSYQAFARIYELQKKYDSAIYYYKKQIDTAAKYRAREAQKAGNYLLGDLYLTLNNYAPAKKYLLAALKLIGKSIDFAPDVNLSLSRLYEKTGDYKKSLQYYKAYNTAKDSVHRDDLERNITKEELNAIYEKQQAEQEKAIDRERKEEAHKLKTQKELRNIFIGVLIASLIIALILYNRYRLKQRVAFELEEKNKIITAQREQAEKLREAAEESKKLKEQFLANMSHEIRTPMNAIKGITELLIEKPHDEESNRYIKAIKQSSDNLLVILNDILDLSKIQAGKFFINHVAFSLKQQVYFVYETLQVLANEKGISLVLNYDESIPEYLNGDPVRITQVLYNIVNNAIKFTDKGNVTLDVKNAKSDISNPEDNNVYVKFIISDTGCGIPADKQQTIFESFAQLEQTKINQQSGTGLGLTISKLMVELMHGKIYLRSEENKGTVFTVKLALAVPDENDIIQPYEDKDSIAGALKNIKVLIAEDNKFNQMMITDTLRKKIPGIKYEVVSNGELVIEKLKHNDYDVLLMDVRMPVMDGITAANYIRNKMPEPKRSIPIIALTASVLRTDLEKCMATGMNAYIAKPFNRNELFNKMASVVKGKKTTSSFQPEKEATLINIQYLQNFAEGDHEEMGYYLKELLDELPKKLLEMQDHIQAKNVEELYKTIHAIKPMLNAVGVNNDQLFDESYFENKNFDKCFINAGQLRHIIEQVYNEVKTLYENEFAV